jgi:hypothetical protein
VLAFELPHAGWASEAGSHRQCAQSSRPGSRLRTVADMGAEAKSGFPDLLTGCHRQRAERICRGPVTARLSRREQRGPRIRQGWLKSRPPEGAPLPSPQSRMPVSGVLPGNPWRSWCRVPCRRAARGLRREPAGVLRPGARSAGSARHSAFPAVCPGPVHGRGPGRKHVVHRLPAPNQDVRDGHLGGNRFALLPNGLNKPH